MKKSTRSAKKADGKMRTGSGSFRLLDYLIILVFLSIAAWSVNKFRLDLQQTINSQNEPVGTVDVKRNVVQRRLADRVLWDRLALESPVYSGDLIRVADLSAATLHIENASLDLNENTLIRIQRSPDGEGPFRIELREGSLSLVSGVEGGSFVLDLMGHEAQAGPGTSLNAAVGEDGIVLQVSGGTVLFIGEGESREIASGSMLALDGEGAEKTDPSVVMMYPRLTARYLKSGSDPLPVYFAWTRINLETNDALRLEIAEDRNFTRIFRVIENLTSVAQTALDAGLWYWRLSFGDDVLSSGRFTITDSSGIRLLSPSMNSVFRYRSDLPELRFQWSEIEDASHYILEVSETADFTNMQINRELSANSFLSSSLGQGTWYWRVQPVFPPAYDDSGWDGVVYSAAAFFSIEQGDVDDLVLELPQPEPEPIVIAEEPPLPPSPPPPPLPPPLLPAPGGRVPATGYRVDIARLQSEQSITFRWSAVPGANAYIFTLYQQTPSGRRQILRRAPENRTGLTLNDLSILDRGTFIWQVEAVSRSRNGAIERRGRPGENTFTVDIPIPGPVQVEETGILYGN